MFLLCSLNSYIQPNSFIDFAFITEVGSSKIPIYGVVSLLKIIVIKLLHDFDRLTNSEPTA